MGAICLLFSTGAQAEGPRRVLRTDRSGLTATAFAQEQSGCVFTFLNVFPTDGRVSEGPGRPEFSSGTVVAITQYEVCSDIAIIASGFGQFPLDASAFTINNSLGSARLVTQVTLTDEFTGALIPVGIDLTWTKASDSQVVKQTVKTLVSGLRIIDRSQIKAESNANVTGSVVTPNATIRTFSGDLRSEKVGTLLFLLGDGRATRQVSQQEVTMTGGSALSAAAGFTSVDGCISSFASISASVPQVGGATTATLFVDQFDDCLRVRLLSTFITDLPLPPGVFTIARDASWAVINGTVQVPDLSTGSVRTVPLTLNLLWTASSTGTQTRLRTRTEADGTTVTTRLSARVSDATVTGSILGPGGFFSPQTIFASQLMNVTESTKTITKSK